MGCTILISPWRRFSSPPTLTVAVEFLPHHTLTWVKDSDTPDGSRLELTGFLNEFVTYFAKAMNFRYRYVVSRERTFGTKLPDGSWTGMMGMLVREEADFSPGPFVLSSVRAEAAQATTEYTQGGLRILSGLTGLKIDPWGFLLPLTPLVWAITLTALLGVLFVRQLLPSCLPGRSLLRCGWSANTFSPVRVLLQQDVVWPTEWWWWERLVLGLWMLTTLVLTRSYAGNLMSLLAVRYVPQPFQTLRDVLDHPSVVMIWQKLSSYEQFLRDVKDGVFREVAELEDVGRLKFHIQTKIPESIDTLVRAAHHVLVETDVLLRNHVALDFSREGECCLVPRGDAPRLVGCCYSVTVLPA
ncbi:probable glutamate receptor [Scylla paramamosain]|uniref:probable glutamate receptor n=1 Tax=Scylla paramamosain TaxID=85552 RepID=UPI0030837D4E